MPDLTLTIPEEFANDPLWEQPARVAAYIRMQMEGARNGQGRIEFSLRRASEDWRMTRYAVQQFLRYLEDRGLISFPEGQQPNRPYPVQLTEAWLPSSPQPEPAPKIEQNTPPVQTAEKTPAPAVRKSTEKTARKPVAQRKTAVRKVAKIEEQQPDLSPEMAPIQTADNGERIESVTNTLTGVLHKVGLYEAPYFTGGLWAKQAAKIRAMVEEHGVAAVEAAIRGTRLVWPFNEGERPFDAFQVEKRFAEAAAAWSTVQREREKNMGRRVEIDEQRANRAELEAAHAERMDEWRKRMHAAIRALPKAERDELEQLAAARVRTVPGLNGNGETGKRMLVQFAYVIMGERLNEHAPPPPRFY